MCMVLLFTGGLKVITSSEKVQNIKLHLPLAADAIVADYKCDRIWDVCAIIFTSVFFIHFSMPCLHF